MNLDDLRERLESACAAATLDGYRVYPADEEDKGCMCPFGAWLYDEKGPGFNRFPRLNPPAVHPDQFRGFVFGFDGRQRATADEFPVGTYELGVRFRERAMAGEWGGIP